MPISPGQLGVAEGYSAAEITYPETGYATAALASYEQFAQHKREGKIASDVRFLVSLATPIAIIGSTVADSEFPALEPGFEAAQLAELQQIIDGIPHRELAIQ